MPLPVLAAPEARLYFSGRLTGYCWRATDRQKSLHIVPDHLHTSAGESLTY
jgi:hypothetical protein